MSLASLPIETVTHIFNLLDESDLETPLDVDEHREVGKALMALRLTCKELHGIATGQLFRRLYLSSSRELLVEASYGSGKSETLRTPADFGLGGR